MKYLFVGGPVDGQRLVVLEGLDRIRIPVKVEVPVLFMPGSGFNWVDVDPVLYTKRSVQCGREESQHYFADSSLSDVAAFNLLLERYAQ